MLNIPDTAAFDEVCVAAPLRGLIYDGSLGRSERLSLFLCENVKLIWGTNKLSNSNASSRLFLIV